VLPGAPIALLALAALLPGWIFIRLSEHRTPRPERSGWAELVELASVGFSTVTVSALAVAGLSWTQIPGLFDVRTWAVLRGGYLGHHLGAALLSALLVALISCVLAYALFLVIYRKKPKGLHPGSTVWYDALGRWPRGTLPVVGVHRVDGSLVEGLLFSYSYTDEETSAIALQAPMRLTPSGEKPFDLALSRVVIPGSQIRALTVVHVPGRQPSKGAAHADGYAACRRMTDQPVRLLASSERVGRPLPTAAAPASPATAARSYGPGSTCPAPDQPTDAGEQPAREAAIARAPPAGRGFSRPRRKLGRSGGAAGPG
jgi:hypothetical protein